MPKTIKELVHQLDKTIKDKDQKVKELYHQCGKHDDGTNKTFKEIENEQVI